MQLEGMDSEFRQTDVLLHFVLGLLSWSGSIARSVANLELVPASAAAPCERVSSGTDQTALQLLLGLISFDHTLRAAIERSLSSASTETECAAVGGKLHLDLGR